MRRARMRARREGDTGIAFTKPGSEPEPPFGEAGSDERVPWSRGEPLLLGVDDGERGAERRGACCVVARGLPPLPGCSMLSETTVSTVCRRVPKLRSRRCARTVSREGGGVAFAAGDCLRSASHGCARSSETLGRQAGSSSKQSRTRAHASLGTSAGRAGSEAAPSQMRSAMSRLLPPKNGKRPTKKAYSTTPRDHTSVGGPT
mmetsp:Transcript_37473/g.94147  ORF Transcript_37473/g.94147 Transcript_37473/m.94147 type:complete len:203 (+) Transcript_37473:780-1388(+)